MKALFTFSPLQKAASLSIGLFGAACFAAYTFFLVFRFDRLDEIGWSYVTTGVSPFLTSSLACLLAYRRPENRISWILAVIATLIQFVYLEPVISVAFLEGRAPTPGMVVLRNLWSYMSGLISTLLAFLFVVFPTGRLLSPRWRVAYWLLGVQVLVSVGRGLYLVVDLVRDFALARRGLFEISLVPLTRTGPTSFSLHTHEIPAQIQVSMVIGGIALAMVLLGLAALIHRYRRGGPLEQQQVKWLLFALVVWAVAIVVIVGPFNGPVALFSLIPPLILGAVSLAILRYRLYDIDIIINRALVYSLLSVLLAAIYYLSVLVLQGIFQRATGGDHPLVVVGSTLLMAAAFNPLRHRVQDFIDRRFYRSKYDAGATLAQFAATARAEVELDTLTGALLGAVKRSMQPRSVSLWLRE